MTTHAHINQVLAQAFNEPDITPEDLLQRFTRGIKQSEWVECVGVKITPEKTKDFKAADWFTQMGRDLFKYLFWHLRLSPGILPPKAKASLTMFNDPWGFGVELFSGEPGIVPGTPGTLYHHLFYRYDTQIYTIETW